MKNMAFATTGEVGKILNLSADGVRYLERTGRLHAIRTISGVRLFDPVDVERLRHERAQRKAQGCAMPWGEIAK